MRGLDFCDVVDDGVDVVEEDEVVPPEVGDDVGDTE